MYQISTTSWHSSSNQIMLVKFQSQEQINTKTWVQNVKVGIENSFLVKPLADMEKKKKTTHKDNTAKMTN